MKTDQVTLMPRNSSGKNYHDIHRQWFSKYESYSSGNINEYLSKKYVLKKTVTRAKTKTPQLDNILTMYLPDRV